MTETTKTKLGRLEAWCEGRSQYAGHKAYRVFAWMDGVRYSRVEHARTATEAKAMFKADYERNGTIHFMEFRP